MILEDPSFLWVLLYQKILKQCRTAVSGNFLCTASLALMQQYTRRRFFVLLLPKMLRSFTVVLQIVLNDIGLSENRNLKLVRIEERF